MEKANKCALIADIIQSRNIENRAQVQEKLKACLKMLNLSFKNELHVNVEISAGDSVQGLFYNTASAFLYIRMLQLLMHPYKFRASLAYGELDFENSTYTSNELDGEAYRNAKNGLDIIRQNKRESIYFYQKNDESNFLNLFMFAYLRIRQQNGDNAKYVMIINEFLNPMSVNGDIIYDNWEEFVNEYYNVKFNEQGNIEKHRKVDLSHSIEKVVTTRILDLNEENVSYNKIKDKVIRRGVQEEISKILETSKQNINKYFVNAITEERILSSQIALELYNREKGKLG